MEIWVHLSDGHWASNDIRYESLKQGASSDELQLQVILPTQIITVMWKAPERIMDGDNLKGLLRHTVDQFEDAGYIDMSQVLVVEVVENSGAEIPCAVIVIPEGNDHFIIVGYGILGE